MLELDGLRKIYDGVIALDGLNFTVEPGQLFGFVGPNGAGKTTTMRIVLGVLGADGGEVRWDGKRLDRSARRRIGYMPEERGLYPKMLVGEQLQYLARLHGLTAPAAEASAAKWMERLGVSERAGDPVEQLSLGNQQRVQLAAALVHEPDLLVLDEPFSGLDPVGVEVLADVLAAEAAERRVPVIFSSHQLELVERLCDAVAIIKDGRLIASGRVEDLRNERSRNRWVVVVEGAPPGWENELEGVRRIDEEVLELGSGVDSQVVLDRARAAGAVVRFGPRRPTLTELFRQAISEEEDERR